MARSARSKSTSPSEESSAKSRTAALPRLSCTVSNATRKKIRIAAALADMEDGEWCRLIVTEHAKRRVAKLYPNKA